MRVNPLTLEKRLRESYGRVRRFQGKSPFRICCPFCPARHGSPDKKFSLGLTPSENVYGCFRCGAGGQITELFRDASALTEQKVAAPARSSLGVPEARLPGRILPLQDLSDTHIATMYLRKRGFTPAALGRYFGMGYCERGKEFSVFDTSNTLFMPVWMGGSVVGWQCRLLYNPESVPDDMKEAYRFPYDSEAGEFITPPKYFTNGEKDRMLMNYDIAARSKYVVVTEGPLDMAAVGPCAVATMGKGVTDVQRRIIQSTWRVAILLLDPDADAENHQLSASLRTVMPAIPVALKGYKDPGDAPTAEIWRQISATMQGHGLKLTEDALGPHWKDYLQEVSR